MALPGAEVALRSNTNRRDEGELTNAPSRRKTRAAFFVQTNLIQAFFGHLRVISSDSPVSNRLLRLERMGGQPCETAWMNLVPGLSIGCVSVSLTQSPCWSSS